MTALHEIAPSRVAQETLTCASCVGACCKAGFVHRLTDPEAQRLRDAGTLMHDINMGSERTLLGTPIRFHWFDSDCGNLDPDTNQCRDYDNRPKECRKLKEGSEQCLAVAGEYQTRIDLGMPDMPARVQVVAELSIVATAAA